jgi:hypothetical protein
MAASKLGVVQSALLISWLIGCNPSDLPDENVSDPVPPGTPPEVFYTYKSETSVLHRETLTEHRMLVAYNDASGFVTVHG